MDYKIITPEQYNLEHIRLIEHYKEHIRLLSAQTNTMIIIKDVHSRIITGSDASAETFGLKDGSGFDGKFFIDLPCEQVAKHEDSFKQQERELINSNDINKNVQVLNVFEYADGLKARLTNKYILHDDKSKSILGILNTATTVQLKNFINIIPSYILQFGALGSIEAITGYSESMTDCGVELTEYEQEICFLLLLNWGFDQIAEFMNKFKPSATERTANTITKKKDSICHKFRLPKTTVDVLCEYLFSIGFHKKMPMSFYTHIVGSHRVD